MMAKPKVVNDLNEKDPVLCCLCFVFMFACKKSGNITGASPLAKESSLLSARSDPFGERPFGVLLDGAGHGF